MARTPTRNPPTSAVAYCATCGTSYGEVDVGREDQIGALFQCPEDQAGNPSHLARIVKGSAGAFWLRVEAYILLWEQSLSPMRWFKSWGGAFRGRAGLYVAVRLGVALATVFALSCLPDSSFRTSLAVLTWVVACIVLADIVISHTSIVFVSRFPAHPIRSVLLALASFFTIAVAFSALYLTSPSGFSIDLTAVSAVYFSMVTITTLGFGEIYPRTDATVPQALVVVELLIGAYFVVVLLGVVASWANERPAEPKFVTLEELIPGWGGAAAQQDGMRRPTP